MRHGFFKNQEAMRGGGGMSYTQSNEIHISRVEKKYTLLKMEVTNKMEQPIKGNNQ